MIIELAAETPSQGFSMKGARSDEEIEILRWQLAELDQERGRTSKLTWSGGSP